MIICLLQNIKVYEHNQFSSFRNWQHEWCLLRDLLHLTLILVAILNFLLLESLQARFHARSSPRNLLLVRLFIFCHLELRLSPLR